MDWLLIPNLGHNFQHHIRRFRVCRSSENVKFHIWQTHCSPKGVCLTLSLIFLYLQIYFLGVGTLHCCASTVPRKVGGKQVLIGLALSSPTVGYLLRPSWLALSARKMQQKSEFNELTSMDKRHSYFWSNTFGKVKNLTK